jgi:hypothetical protein
MLDKTANAPSAALTERERILYDALTEIITAGEAPRGASESYLVEHWDAMVRTAEIAKKKFDSEIKSSSADIRPLNAG